MESFIQKQAPYSLEQRSRIILAAERLSSEISAALKELPEQARGGSALSRFLALDRATCQRAIQAAQASDGLEALRKAPGPGGIRSIVEALSGRVSAGALAGLTIAVDDYETVIRELGGSQTRLLARLDRNPSAFAESGLRARRMLFESAAEIVGRWSEVNMILSVYRPSPDGRSMDRVNATGFIGHQGRPDAMALTTGSGRLSVRAGESGGARSLDGSPAEGATPLALLPEYCTRPLPKVISRQPTKASFQILDYDGSESARPVDVVTARMNASPIELPSLGDPVHAIWMSVSYPARRLIADVYLHRSLATRSIPGLSVQMNDPHHFDPKDWARRFRDQPMLQVLGSGLSCAACAAYPRQPEVTATLFERMGWDQSEFVGYRCEAEFPIWRASYCVWFDFSGNIGDPGLNDAAEAR